MSIPSDSPDPQRAPHGAGRPAPVSSDHLLPPVEPPSAGFLLQLFVVPAVIVACVVAVWFGIESLARSGQEDTATILRELRGSNGFQQANDLAEMLRVPERYPELRTKRDLAQGVAVYLDELIQSGDDSDNVVNMRIFLVSLLGEMHVDDGLPMLVKTARSDPERYVRRKAINAIAVLAGTLARQKPPQYLTSDELVDALIELANDQDELIRSETAFAIGVVASAPDADSRLVDALRVLADDPYTDARFNAAVGLARIGSPLAPRAVAEMFDLEAIEASISGEKPIMEGQTAQSLHNQQAYKRNTILTSALSAVDMLLEHKTPPAEMAVVEQALEKFLAAAPKVQQPAPLPKELLDAAQRTLSKLQAARS